MTEQESKLQIPTLPRAGLHQTKVGLLTMKRWRPWKRKATTGSRQPPQNGDAVTNPHTVTGAVSIMATASALGFVYIDTGTELKAYMIYIDTETIWKRYRAYVDNGTSFKLY